MSEWTVSQISHEYRQMLFDNGAVYERRIKYMLDEGQILSSRAVFRFRYAEPLECEMEAE